MTINWPNFVPSFDLAAQFLLGLTFAVSGRSAAVAVAAKRKKEKLDQFNNQFPP